MDILTCRREFQKENAHHDSGTNKVHESRQKGEVIYPVPSGGIIVGFPSIGASCNNMSQNIEVTITL